MVEYGLILALVSVVAIGILATIGTDVKAVFTEHRELAGRRVGPFAGGGGHPPPGRRKRHQP